MIWTILLFLVVLSVLVIAHEWGHYAAAKKIGADVEEFGLGFPPRLFSWKGKDGMIWSFNAIPIGGFVKIRGESGEDRSGPGSFANKGIFQRLFVLAAGVVMNLFLAAILFSIGFMVGIPAITEGGVSGAAMVSNEAMRVAEILPGSAAEEAGLKLGDTLISIDGIEFENSEQARSALVPESIDQIFDVTILREDQELTLSIDPKIEEGFDNEIIGIALLETGTVRYPLYLAPIKGVETTFVYTRDISIAFYQIIKNLILGRDPGVELSGPVGIAVMTGEVASMGFVYLMQFGAILSINLAIINILPFPALDGGRIFFVMIEAVRRKPTSPEFEAVVHNLGFVVLMLLVIFVTYKDILGLL